MGIHRQFVSNPAGFSGGWLDTIQKIIPQVVPYVLGQTGGGGQGSTIIKGRAASAAFVNQVLSGLDQIAAQVRQLPPNEIVANSQQITDTILSLYHSFKNPAVIQWNGSYLQAGYDEAQRKTYGIQQQIQAAYDIVQRSPVGSGAGSPAVATNAAPDLMPLLLYSAIGIGLIMLMRD